MGGRFNRGHGEPKTENWDQSEGGKRGLKVPHLKQVRGGVGEVARRGMEDKEKNPLGGGGGTWARKKIGVVGPTTLQKKKTQRVLGGGGKFRQEKDTYSIQPN